MEPIIPVACFGFAVLFAFQVAMSFRAGRIVMGLMQALTALSIAAIGLYVIS